MFRLCYAILRLCITIQDQKVQLEHVTKNRYFSFCHIRYVHTQHSNNGTNIFNLLTPNVNYSGRTAPLTSKVTFYIFIQQT